MNAQEVTAKYHQRAQEILERYHIVVDAAKQQKREALEELEVWFTETYDGLKEKPECSTSLLINTLVTQT